MKLANLQAGYLLHGFLIRTSGTQYRFVSSILIIQKYQTHFVPQKEFSKGAIYIALQRLIIGHVSLIKIALSSSFSLLKTFDSNIAIIHYQAIDLTQHVHAPIRNEAHPPWVNSSNTSRQRVACFQLIPSI